MRFYGYVLTVLFSSVLFKHAKAQEQPKLVIGIIVDQMRYDYLYRYWNDYGDKGFKRLLEEGFILHDGHYQYAPTYTGPGHASVYTGTNPNVHGIIGNEWYDRKSKSLVNCVGDESANTVGSDSYDGKMSPHRLLSTTLADQIELATNKRSKTIGISIKDRGAILPAGRKPDAAYWYDKSNGRFITSDYYMKDLPEWVKAFNDRKLVDQYMSQTWQTLLPLDRYDESLPDDKPFERAFPNTEKAVFPYDLSKISQLQRFGIKNSPYNLLPATPFGNTLLFDFAKATLESENMGKDDIVDLLAMSFSSTDYAGHQFGNFSVEVQDMYLRLDRELGEFFDYLDQGIGLKNILIFLTADHAAEDVPGLVSPPGDYFRMNGFEAYIRHKLNELTGSDPIESFSNQQIYLIKNDSIDLKEITKIVSTYALLFPGVRSVIALNDFSNCIDDPLICDLVRKGIMPTRSGDLYIQLHPGWINEAYLAGGTTHGSTYAHDTHVPIIFFGGLINASNNYKRAGVQDIAPTISALLKIARPSGSTGMIIEDVLK
ncbi:MAG: alkaline phosphatase family protein [Saprospiraceae bacterium]|nr:alkaline phosphatase family protein [Saprospiraceae bacterium]